VSQPCRAKAITAIGRTETGSAKSKATANQTKPINQGASTTDQEQQYSVDSSSAVGIPPMPKEQGKNRPRAANGQYTALSSFELNPKQHCNFSRWGLRVPRQVGSCMRDIKPHMQKDRDSKTERQRGREADWHKETIDLEENSNLPSSLQINGTRNDYLLVQSEKCNNILK
jgi:hypothetical protein